MARDAESRERRTKFTAYILFGAIIIVFVFWGMKGDDMTSGGGGYAATVNNTVISIGEFRRAVEQQMQFYSRIFGKQFDMNDQRSMQIRNSTLDRLISQELMVQGAEDQGILASDAEVRQQIFDIPAFQKDGRFQRDAYNNYLTYVRMSPAQFETDLRKDLVLKDVKQIFETASKPTTGEIEKEILARSLKMNLEFVAYDPNEAGQHLRVADAEVEKFLKSEDSAKKIEEFYNSHRTDYVKEGEVRARHILIKADQGNKAAEDAAKAKIKIAQERLKNEPFEKVAKEMSEDAGSKENGGDLGFFGKGRMVPPFEVAAFAQEKGKVGEPVQTSFGFHIIEVTDKKGGETRTVEQARREIAGKVLAKDRGGVWLSEVEKALALPDGAEKNARIDGLVKESGLKWDATGAFDAGAQMVPKIGAVDALAIDAFGLTKEKLYPGKLYRNASKSYVVRFKDVTEDRSAIKADETADQISRSRAQDAQQAWEKKLTEKAKIQRNQDLVAEQ
ncbi:MAG: SurA N-terminal domain-containing protein [Bdellovibrionia bacterium]